MKKKDWIFLGAIFILTSVIGIGTTTMMQHRFDQERNLGKAELRKEMTNGAKTCEYTFQMNSTLTDDKKVYFHCCQYTAPYECTERNGLGKSF